MELKAKQKFYSLPGVVEIEQGQQYHTSKNQGSADSLKTLVGFKTLNLFAEISEIWQWGPGKWESLLLAVLVQNTEWRYKRLEVKHNNLTKENPQLGQQYRIIYKR